MKKLFLYLFVQILISCSNPSLVDAEIFKNNLELSSVNFIDVRTFDEFSVGHIPKSINIDWNNSSEFKKNIELLDKNKATYVYCLSGGRSSKASQFLKNAGFKKVYELSGGILEWRKNNYPELNLSKPINIFNLKNYYNLLDSEKFVLISFNAKWCAPCLKMKPFLSSISNEMDTVLEYHTINYDDNKDLMKELNIYSLPTIFIYKNNKILYSIKEYIEEDQLRNKINELIKDYN